MEWIDKSRIVFFERLRPAVFVFLVVLMVVAYFLAREHTKWPILFTALAMFVVNALHFQLKSHFKIKSREIVLMIIFIACAGFGWMYHENIKHYPSVAGVIPGTLFFMFAIGMSVILSPLMLYGTIILTLMMVGLLGLILWKVDILVPRDLAECVMLALGWSVFGIYGHTMSTRTTHRAALLVSQNKKLIETREQLKKEAFERELELAESIQNSLAEESEIRFDSNIMGMIYQKKQGFLGGDWTASFQDKKGHLFIVMADITGKGIPAALVVHALSALWVAGTDKEKEFDPLSWIKEVNSTLIVLGRNSPQTLSLGMIVIRGTTLSYISAGHVPLYLVSEEEHLADTNATAKRSTVIRALSSRGNLLGVAEDLKLEVKEIDISNFNLRWILGGTDGVFMSGTRMSPREGQRMVELLKNSGVPKILAQDNDDDRVLLVLEKNVS